MKLTHILTLAAAVALPHFIFAEEEEDKPVKFDELPAAVAKAIKKAAGDAKLDKIILGDEDGTPAYEAIWKAGGHQHEIAVANDGNVLSLEEIITLAEAPEAVRAAIVKKAVENKVLEVEKVVEKGKTKYEATIQKDKAKEEVSFDAAGKVLERENPDAEKDEKSEKGGKKEKKD